MSALTNEINNTAAAALDGVEGQPGVGYVISENQEIAIKSYEEGSTNMLFPKVFSRFLAVSFPNFSGDFE